MKFKVNKIAVGSTNPVKVKAVRNIVKKVWPKAKVIKAVVSSGVREQPVSNKEAIEGATERARLALNISGADLGVGLEGCTVDTEYGMFTHGWVVAIDKIGNMGLGCSARIMLPKKIASEIRKGKELGPLMDKLAGKKDTKKNLGTGGILTKGLVKRTENFEQAVAFALSKFISPEHYN